MARVRVQLETPDGQHHFPPGTYSIGRADDCDVVLSSGRCSRYHARLVVDAQGAALEDLGSANGTFVNGVRIAERHALNNGDFVVVGGELGLEVSIETEISISDTTPRRPGPSRTEGQAPYLPPTARVPMDEVLEAAADHLIAKGQPELAERTLGRWLETALAAAKGGNWHEPPLVEMALRCAAKLAKSLPSRRWTDYVLELSATLSRPLSAEEAKLLDAAIGATGASAEPLARYTSMLRAVSATTDFARAMHQAEAWRESVRVGD